jgi:hypothetical protein
MQKFRSTTLQILAAKSHLSDKQCVFVRKSKLLDLPSDFTDMLLVPKRIYLLFILPIFDYQREFLKNLFANLHHIVDVILHVVKLKIKLNVEAIDTYMRWFRMTRIWITRVAATTTTSTAARRRRTTTRRTATTGQRRWRSSQPRDETLLYTRDYAETGPLYPIVVAQIGHLALNRI